MTPKIHLTAYPANEGARRLVWLLLDRDLRSRGVSVRTVLRGRGCGDMMIDRLVHGEIAPGYHIGTGIYLVSDGAIRAADWNRPAEGGWFDRPEGWPNFAEAMRAAA